MSSRGRAWTVRRTGGLLPPGFTKRFDAAGSGGVTYLAKVPIGWFDVHGLGDGRVELRYRRWPIVDVLERAPRGGGSIPGAGYLRPPAGGRSVRFCRFRLER